METDLKVWQVRSCQGSNILCNACMFADLTTLCEYLNDVRVANPCNHVGAYTNNVVASHRAFIQVTPNTITIQDRIKKIRLLTQGLIVQILT